MQQMPKAQGFIVNQVAKYSENMNLTKWHNIFHQHSSTGPLLHKSSYTSREPGSQTGNENNPTSKIQLSER